MNLRTAFVALVIVSLLGALARAHYEKTALERDLAREQAHTATLRGAVEAQNAKIREQAAAARAIETAAAAAARRVLLTPPTTPDPAGTGPEEMNRWLRSTLGQ